jgi:hypothetical protein
MRKSDSKVFTLPRKFKRTECQTPKGYSMKSSCAPYKDCQKFLFPGFNVYINKNPDDTIPIKYSNFKETVQTIKKLEKLYKQKKYDHKRISQVGMILYVRLKVLKKKKPREFELAKRYFDFLKDRTKASQEARFKLKFKFN